MLTDGDWCETAGPCVSHCSDDLCQTRLKTIVLGQNLLSGSIPNGLAAASNLFALLLSGVRIGGSVAPEALLELKHASDPVIIAAAVTSLPLLVVMPCSELAHWLNLLTGGRQSAQGDFASFACCVLGRI